MAMPPESNDIAFIREPRRRRTRTTTSTENVSDKEVRLKRADASSMHALLIICGAISAVLAVWGMVRFVREVLFALEMLGRGHKSSQRKPKTKRADASARTLIIDLSHTHGSRDERILQHERDVYF